MIILIFIVGLLLYIMQYLQYEQIKRFGEFSTSMEMTICCVSIIRNWIVIIFVLLLSNGIQIIYQSNYKQTLIQMYIIALQYLVCLSIYSVLKQGDFLTGWVTYMISAIHSLSLLATLIFCYIKMKGVMREILDMKEYTKVQIYNRLTIMMGFTLSVAFIAAMFKLGMVYSNISNSDLWKYSYLG